LKPPFCHKVEETVQFPALRIDWRLRAAGASGAFAGWHYEMAALMALKRLNR